MSKSKGLGDSIEKALKATGIDKVAKKVLGDDCGCEERKKKLNQMFHTLGHSQIMNYLFMNLFYLD